MVAWRAAGLNYVRYSQIAAQVVRQCTKGASQGAKKPASTLQTTIWENGKAIKKQ